MPYPPSPDIVVVHSSDLHMDHDYTARLHGGDGTAGLSSVIKAARDAAAQVLVLAGDTFDCHRVPLHLLERAAAIISTAALPVVLLPGNHDPAVPDAVYHNGPLAAVENLHVLGVTHEEAVCFADLDLEIWGRAHRDYGDMIPFERLRPRSTRWQIAMAHGHYVPVPDRTNRLRPSSSATMSSRPLVPTILPSGIGTGPRRSEPWPPITPARRNMPARSTWCGWPLLVRSRSRARRLGSPASLRPSIRPRTHPRFTGSGKLREVDMRCSVFCLALVFAAELIVAPLGAVAQSQTPAGTWTQKAPMPAVRGEVAAAAVGDKLFALGGGVGGKAVFEYDPASDRWRTLAPMKAPRASVGVTVLRGKVYVIGGRGLDAVTVTTHEVYDPASGAWSEA